MSSTEKTDRRRDSFDILLRVDIFQVSTGERVAQLSGFFSLDYEHLSDDPVESLANATWISDRHFIVPALKHLGAMLCDMQPAAPLRETAWDFIEPSDEILGFWEEPHLVGYFNALNSLLLHTAIRAADDREYNLKASLSGPKAESVLSYPRRLEAGIRSIDGRLNYPQSDGAWEVGSITLMRGLPGTVAATAAHLGSTEEYLSYWVHRDPEPRPLISTAGNRIPPPIPGRRLPDSIQASGLDLDPSGKFAALGVSMPLTNLPT